MAFLNLNKKNDATISADNIARESVPLTDYIPYYSHYNANTILTKNGELLQIIKIASNTMGLNYESGDSRENSVREVIRKAVAECIKTDHFSFWVHIVRRRKPIQFEGNYSNPFAAYVHESWRKKHRWQYQYYNEVYLTVLREGQSSEMRNRKHFKHTFLPALNRDFRNRYLDAMYKDLDQAVTSMLQIIRGQYNAHLLGIVERVPTDIMPSLPQPIFFSEPMEFLGTILNLTTEPFPLPELDISSAINNHTVTFGYNALETKGASGHRRFGALLTLKQYQEAPTETIDRILQSSTELIISQSFAFISNKVALKSYQAQKELFEISGDAYSARMTGLEDILRNNQKRTIDFGEQQTSVMVIVDEYKNLEHEVTKTLNNFGELGMTTVREDIMLEEAFWAQLPGNFEFIRRKDNIAANRSAGLSRLNRFPTGTDTGNHWHEALTVIPTQVSSPFFFNFHKQDNGHTLLSDFNSFHDAAGKSVLNFLLTMSYKFDGRLFLFDRNLSARLLCDKLDAAYHFAETGRPLHLNPFTLENTPRDNGFLLAWCVSVLDPVMNVTAEHKEFLRIAIEQTYAGSSDRHNMIGFTNHLAALDTQLAANMTAALNAITSCRFGMGENINLSERAVGVNMDALVKGVNGSVPVFAYLLHRIISSLDGKPTLIVIHEALDLLENAFFGPRLESLLEMLKQNNAAVIFTVTSPQNYGNTNTLQTLMQCCATKLYVPDDINLDYTTQELDITAQDSKLLQSMERESGDFLLKQGSNESIALRINLDDLGDIKSIFANDIKNLITAGGRFASLPKN